jgi:hypothetical protein
MISLEHLADGSLSDRNFQALMRLVLDTGGITAGVRWGAQALTFAASTNSATATVSHGLGRVPVVGFAQAYGAPGFGEIPNPNMFGFDADSFDLNGEVKTAFSGTVTMMWVVIG